MLFCFRGFGRNLRGSMWRSTTQKGRGREQPRFSFSLFAYIRIYCTCTRCACTPPGILEVFISRGRAPSKPSNIPVWGSRVICRQPMLRTIQYTQIYIQTVEGTCAPYHCFARWTRRTAVGSERPLIRSLWTGTKCEIKANVEAITSVGSRMTDRKLRYDLTLKITRLFSKKLVQHIHKYAVGEKNHPLGDNEQVTEVFEQAEEKRISDGRSSAFGFGACLCLVHVCSVLSHEIDHLISAKSEKLLTTRLVAKKL